MRKGWFKLPWQEGDRAPEEQLLGLAPALEEGKGRYVLDLGCAEGVITHAFAQAGATRVVGIELLQDHVNVARKVCKMDRQVSFVVSELGEYIENNPNHPQFDIVLALSIAHKIHDPGIVMRFAAKTARSTVVFRGPGKMSAWDGILRSKFGGGFCHVPTIMQEYGFEEGETLPSGRDERVQYWRRR